MPPRSETQGERLARLDATVEAHIKAAADHDAAMLKTLEAIQADMKAMRKELEGLTALKNRGIGVVLAMSIFGALIVMGIVAFIKDVVK
jgi:hypothetical protein